MPKSIIEKTSPTGFLASYISYASALTDAPVEFHFGAALTILAAACGSRIIFPGFGGRRQWPNLYTLLIAPSGLYRKSTSIGIAEDILAQVDSDLILSGEQSREKFLAILKDKPTCLYPISEFSSVLSMWSRDFAMGFKEIVTDLFDCRQEYVRQTLKDGKIVIKQPAVNILAASTVDWLRDKLTEGDLRGGLMGRFIMIPGVSRGEDRGLNIVGDAPAKEKLVSFLSSIYALQRSWVDVKSVLNDYNKWVKHVEGKMLREASPDLVGFQSRLPAHALKLAVLFAVSDSGAQTKFDLTLSHLEQAETLAEWLLEQACEIAETGFIKSKIEQQVQKLVALARRNGGVRSAEALRLLHVSAKEFVGIAETAVKRGEIRVIRESTPTKTAIVYQAPEGVL